MTPKPLLPGTRSLRKASSMQRKSALDGYVEQLEPGLCDQVQRLVPHGEPGTGNHDGLDFADAMVENAYGLMALPLGICLSLQVNKQEVLVPMATEEPSVIAAASYAGSLVGMNGGFECSAQDPLMKAHVYLQVPPQEIRRACSDLEALRPRLEGVLVAHLARMEARGGGFRGLSFTPLEEQAGTVKVEFIADVRDALGANLLNTGAEALRPLLEEATGGRVLMAILSNNAELRLARARFSLPVEELRSGPWRGMEHAQRICDAAWLAQVDVDRAVTHNKGIMNGISALALATGNDTRALEAAVHAWAARSGRYRGLSSYEIRDGNLVGTLEAPLCLASAGGAADCHPQARYNRTLMGKPGSRELACVAAALGLAQNLAALMALTGEGIQGGHMRLHQRRLEWQNRVRSQAPASGSDPERQGT